MEEGNISTLITPLDTVIISTENKENEEKINSIKATLEEAGTSPKLMDYMIELMIKAFDTFDTFINYNKSNIKGGGENPQEKIFEIIRQSLNYTFSHSNIDDYYSNLGDSKILILPYFMNKIVKNYSDRLKKNLNKNFVNLFYWRFIYLAIFLTESIFMYDINYVSSFREKGSLKKLEEYLK